MIIWSIKVFYASRYEIRLGFQSMDNKVKDILVLSAD